MDDKKEMNSNNDQDMGWQEILAYGCAISVGAVATLLLGASLGGLLGKAVKSIGVKKGAEILAKTVL